MNDVTTVWAHRGCTEASESAPAGCTENTLDAFAEARRRGADGVELDVRLTADGALAIHHDAEIPGVGLVKGAGGSTAQVVNDRPLWFKDKFTTIASAGLSWLLVDTATGAVITGGSKVSTLEISGTIGTTVKVNPPTTMPM